MCEEIFTARSSSGLGQAFSDGVTSELDPVVDVELVHQAGAVALDGLRAQVHQAGYLFLGETAGQVTQDLDLSIREGL